jgi:hypothetical protein
LVEQVQKGGYVPAKSGAVLSATSQSFSPSKTAATNALPQQIPTFSPYPPYGYPPYYAPYGYPAPNPAYMTPTATTVAIPTRNIVYF